MREKRKILEKREYVQKRKKTQKEVFEKRKKLSACYGRGSHVY